jgi:undecaprenyl-diphosphatase
MVRPKQAQAPHMTLFNLMILAIVQGITEFLPISSSAHLVLLHQIGGPTAEALALDVAVHLGSIIAVVIYFRHDVVRALNGTVEVLRGSVQSPEAKLALGLFIATIPAVIAGAILALTGWIHLLRNATVIGWMMILFGVFLYAAHRFAPESRRAGEWTLRDAVIMGLWQAVALVPGVSRSGITLTSARLLGFDRYSAARVAMLMSIPITLATGLLLGREVLQSPVGLDLVRDAAIAGVLAFAAAYVALATMMKLLRYVSFTPYVIYRVMLGFVLLAMAYS